MEPQIRFCTSADGARIAYAEMGTGPPLILSSGWAGMEEESNHPAAAAYRGDISQRRLLIQFDRRGIGASQREVSHLSLEAHVADLAAVADHLQLEQFELFGHTDASPAAIAYTASHPDRVSRLVLWSPCPSGEEIGRPEAVAAMAELIRTNWGLARRAMADVTYPSGPLDLQQWMQHSLRQAMSPEVAAECIRFRYGADVRPHLPQVKAPTLVLHRRDNRSVPVSAARAVAALIPNARFVALEGDVEDWWYDHQQYVPLMFEFLSEGESTRDKAAFPTGTAVILFADIADSTALTERLGDAGFRERARELDGALRQAIESNGGTAIEGKLLGDGVLATFGAARAAIACAQACHAAGSHVGLPLHVGIHAGDVISEEGNVYGGAVNIAARVADLSAPGETLVSGTVRELARTSAGVLFEDRDERELKGVSEPVRVFAVRQSE